MSTQQIEITPASVIAAIEAAQGDWTGWDWTMDFAGPEEDDGEPSIVYYSRRPADDDATEAAKNARAYADAVESDAAAASTLADQAIVAIEAGDYERAAELMVEASRIESEYGDDPAYAHARRITEELAKLGTTRCIAYG